MATFANDMV